MKALSLIFFTIILVIIIPTNLKSDNKIMTITYQTKQSENDKRFDYDNELLKLALEKTKTKYGSYKLVPLAVKANYKRVEAIALEGKVENLFYKTSVTKDRLNKLDYVNFPIDLGIVGYRVAFISEKNQNKIKTINNIEDLKQFKILQGLGWLDIKILNHHGFKVITGTNYEGLFKMISKNRGDLFIRGANELYDEWHSHKHLKGLAYDKAICLYYPLPRFFFTSKGNTEAIKRIKEGLVMAYNDGSLIKLWKKHYWKSVVFSDLKQRKIFKISNPFLEGIDKSYEKYLYTP